jgi:hypothetical protein
MIGDITTRQLVDLSVNDIETKKILVEISLTSSKYTTIESLQLKQVSNYYFSDIHKRPLALAIAIDSNDIIYLIEENEDYCWRIENSDIRKDGGEPIKDPFYVQNYSDMVLFYDIYKRESKLNIILEQ